MSKSFQAFYDSHNGKKYGDGQCVAGMIEFLRWCENDSSIAIPGPSAQNIGENWQSNGLAKYCKDVTNKKRKDGDIIFMTGAQAGGSGGNGHVAMYYKGNLFGQNQNSGDWRNGGPFNDSIPCGAYFLALRERKMGASLRINVCNGVLIGIAKSE